MVNGREGGLMRGREREGRGEGEKGLRWPILFWGRVEGIVMGGSYKSAGGGVVVSVAWLGTGAPGRGVRASWDEVIAGEPQFMYPGFWTWAVRLVATKPW